MTDAVADFLDRERGLLDEGETSEVPPVNVEDAVPEIQDIASTIPTTDELFGEPVVAQPDVSDFGFADPVPVVNGLAADNFASSQSFADSRNSSTPSFPVIEAENIRKWREEQKVLLEKKDEDEAKKIEEWKVAAKKELDDWYRQRDATVVNAKEANKKAEAGRISALEKDQDQAAQWEEIAKMCDGKAQKGGKDISRMKSLLMHLKDLDVSK